MMPDRRLSLCTLTVSALAISLLAAGMHAFPDVWTPIRSYVEATLGFSEERSEPAPRSSSASADSTAVLLGWNTSGNTGTLGKLESLTPQATYFSQDFSSSTIVSSYISATPDSSQFNSIGSDGSGMGISINAGRLQFARSSANNGSYVRTTNFTPTPSTLKYGVDVTVSDNGFSAAYAAAFQVGSGFSSTNAAEVVGNVHSRFGVNFTTTPGNWSVRETPTSTASSLVTGTQRITWFINNSGSSISYIAPNGVVETLANDRSDLWIGNSRVFNDSAATTATQSLNNIKFAFTGGIGTIQIDNIAIEDITPAPALADFTNLQFPSTTTVNGSEATETIYGRIFEAGVTEGAGASASVTAHLGYGPLGSDPRTSPAWVYFPAAFSTQTGNDDEYSATITAPNPPSTTQYAYTYRFSLDGGTNWTYADLNGNGTNAGLSFDPAQLGSMTVSPAAMPEIAVTPGAMSFGNQPIGSTSGTRSVTITNSGTGSLNIGQLAKGGADADQFTIVIGGDPSNTVIAPGGTAKVRVTFSPTGESGSRFAQITIPNNDSDESATTVVNLSGTSTAAITPAPVKSMWVWGATPNPVTDPGGRSDLIQRAAANGITDLYVSIYSPTPNSQERLMYESTDIAAVIAAAHTAGVKVWAAYGDPAWQNQPCADGQSPYERMQEIAAYNAERPTDQGFDGVMLDVEPGGAFDLTNYANMHNCLRGILPTSINLGTAISAFWHTPDRAAVEYPAGGESKDPAQHIIDLPLDQIVVMGYRDNAGTSGGNGIIGLDEFEIGYASTIGKAGLVLAGLETKDLGVPAEENVTFFEEGNAVLVSESAIVGSHFAASIGFGGFSIHAYGDEYLSGITGWPFGTAPEMDTSASSLSFGTGLVGSPSTAQSITISNTGNANLNYSFATTGDSGDFIITGTTPNVVAPGNSAQIDVQFSPTSLGQKTATLTITGDDPTNTTDTVTLTGTGNAPGEFSWTVANSDADEGAGFAALTIQRTNGTLGTVDVNWGTDEITANGEATCMAGVDFVQVPAVVTFLDGETSKTVNVQLCDDAISEPNESFRASLVTTVGGGTIVGPQDTEVRIIDDEPRTLVVDNTSDLNTMDECTAVGNDCSLRGAIGVAQDGDTIAFDTGAMGIESLSAAIITLGGSAIVIDNDITITGPGADKLTINGNNASGVFEIVTSTVEISGLKITGGNDSAILVAAGAVTLDRLYVTANSGTNGGGLRFIGGGTHAIYESTFSANQASGLGGGIFVDGGSLSLDIINSTISGNSANDAGGIYMETVIREVTIISSTITGNTGTFASGVVNGSGTVIVANSLIAGNTNAATVAEIDGIFTSLGYNLIGNPGFATGFGSTGDQLGSSGTPIDPKLGPLQNNAGPTPTHALLGGSPAIDKGKSSIATDRDQTDQRGVPRPVDLGSVTNAPGGDGSDIGAFEALAPSAASASISGRVCRANGVGLRGVIITVQGMDGAARTALTNSFGYYRIDGLTVGESFVVSASARRYAFAAPAQFVNLMDDLSGLDFRALQ